MKLCPYTASCPFFGEKLRELPHMAHSLQDMYCQQSHENCARYKIRSSLGKGSVPPDLWPHQVDRAKEIISRLYDPSSG